MAKTQQKATTLSSSSSLVCPRYIIATVTTAAATLLIVVLAADGLGLRFGRGGHALWSSSGDVADDVATAVQLSNDPESYFGGPENDNQAYVNWAKNIISSRYNASVYLPSAMDPSLGAAIHWRIVNDEWLHIAVAARATGWVGFGLSGAGGMLGSDMALFVASRPSEIVDAHVIETFFPQPDDCQQDWLIRTSVVEKDNANGEEQRQVGTTMDELEESGFLTFEARRKLDTGDPQDWPITVHDADPSTPPHRIIAAWGDDGDNGVWYHGKTNVARGAIRFYSTKEEDPQSAFERAMKTNKAEGSFLLQAPQYSIPPQETTYIEFCFARADLLQQGVPDTTSDLLNVIGFQPFVTPGSEPYVHHFVVYGSYDSSIADCNELDYVHVAYAWAPGDGGFALPDFLGAPLFGPSGFQSFYLQIHYNNPRLDRGIVDSSGVQLFYTSQPREYEMGLLQLGDPDVELDGTKVGADLTAHTFECPSSCSALFLGGDGEPVTVFRTHLHMHQHGTRVSNEQIRNGQVVRTASVEVWEFDQNGNAPVLQEPYQIFPGDAFRTSCYYRGSFDTEFGFSSSEEMCISFLYYYPRKSIHLDDDDAAPHPWICGYGYDDHLPVCAENYTHSSLAQDSFMNREFGQPTCTIQDSP